MRYGKPFRRFTFYTIFKVPHTNARGEIRPMTKFYISISVAGRYGRCRISSSVKRLMSKDPAPSQGSGAVGDQRQDTIATVAG